MAQANSAKAKADADRIAAEAEIAVAQARAQATRAEIAAMGPDAWIKKYAIDHKVTPWPNPVVAGQAAPQ